MYIIIFVTWRDKALLGSNLSNQVMIIQKRLYSFFGNPVAINPGVWGTAPILMFEHHIFSPRMVFRRNIFMMFFFFVFNFRFFYHNRVSVFEF